MAVSVADREAAGQRWSAEDYARTGRFVADLGMPLLSWLQPQAGERVLDLGCGDGVLSQRLALAGCEVRGVDASPEMVAAAQARGLSAEVCDAQALGFEREFDAVFSNAALHWMKRDPDAVLRGVARALKPGGRFVAEMGAAGNVVTIRSALHDALARRGIDACALDPWYFPSQAEYSGRLEAAGFVVRRIETFPRPTPLPGDLIGWLTTFAGAFTAAIPADQRAAFLEEVCEAVRPSLCQDGCCVADYVRLRFEAQRGFASHSFSREHQQ